MTSEAQELRRVDPLAELESLVQRLAETITLRKTIDVLVEEARRMTSSRAAHIVLASESGVPDPADLEGLPADASAAAQAALVTRTRREGGAWSALPLVVRNRAIGALLLESPPASESSYLGALATHAALALDRALLHEFESAHRAELESSESRFRSLVQELDAVFWECDVETFQFSFVSERAEKLLGYPVSDWLTPGFWASILHPEDRHWALDFCVACTKEGRDHAFEYRMTAADGRVLWFRDIVYVMRDAEGRPSKLRGVMLDITHERAQNPAQRVAKRISRMFG